MAATSFNPDLELVRFLPRSIVSRRSLRLLRAGTAVAIVGSKRAKVVRVDDDVTVRLFMPPSIDGPAPALLWIHGGGYVIGKAAMDDTMCIRLSEDLGLVVASVEYRLAPEHPFPTPLEDCYSGLVWLAGLSTVDRTRVAVGGMSAGAGLAAALAQLAYDRGEVGVAFQSLSYPMLDDGTVDRPDPDPDSLRLWSADSNRFGWASYLGGSDSPLVAAARRVDLSDLPPAWIGVGTSDLFYAEDEAYALRLSEAGVDCELFVADGGYHAFDAIEPKAPVSREFVHSRDASLAAGLGIEHSPNVKAR